MAPNDKNGTKGFSPQLSGHGKASHSGTSGFDAAPGTRGAADQTDTVAGQEEGGKAKHPSTSSVGKIIKK